MSQQTTFNLTDLYRALGLRDQRVIPNVEGGQVVPIISLGEFRSFAPEVIEARGFVNAGPFNILAGQQLALSMLSAAPGGTIIEVMSSSDLITWNIAPVKPFTGSLVQPFSMGGQPLSNLFEVTGIVLGGIPTGSSLGGSNTPAAVFGSNILADVWVAAGSYFWGIQNPPNPTSYFSWRYREIPTAQGPA